MAEVTSYPSRVGATTSTSFSIQASHNAIAEAVYRSGSTIATTTLASTQAVALIVALLPHLFDRFTAGGECPIFFEHGFLVLLQGCDLLDPLAAAQLALQGSSYQS